MSDIPTITLFARNDQRVRILGLFNEESSPPQFVDNATVIGTLFDPHDEEVDGAKDLTMTYDAGSEGNYSAQIIGAQFDPTPGNGYYLAVDVNSRGGYWEIPVVIVERRSQ
jgi:hypothetical protein